MKINNKLGKSSYRWYKVGEYWCPRRKVLSSDCVLISDVRDGHVKLGMDIDIDEIKSCKGVGTVSGRVPTMGTPKDNISYKPVMDNSWCWDVENDYCRCDCEMYTDKTSCMEGYLELKNDNCGSSCYCWGCNWS